MRKREKETNLCKTCCCMPTWWLFGTSDANSSSLSLCVWSVRPRAHFGRPTPIVDGGGTSWSWTWRIGNGHAISIGFSYTSGLPASDVWISNFLHKTPKRHRSVLIPTQKYSGYNTWGVMHLNYMITLSRLVTYILILWIAAFVHLLDHAVTPTRTVLELTLLSHILLGDHSSSIFSCSASRKRQENSRRRGALLTFLSHDQFSSSSSKLTQSWS
jgi:hypothetical protein